MRQHGRRFILGLYPLLYTGALRKPDGAVAAEHFYRRRRAGQREGCFAAGVQNQCGNCSVNAPLRCTNKYTVYHRNDPFPRMVIALDTFDRIDEWTPTHTFYAWDVCIPGTLGYTLQHVVPSIYSTATYFRRHRLCTVYPSLPWEFRMKMFVFPADVTECTVDMDGSVAEIALASV